MLDEVEEDADDDENIDDENDEDEDGNESIVIGISTQIGGEGEV